MLNNGLIKEITYNLGAEIHNDMFTSSRRVRVSCTTYINWCYAIARVQTYLVTQSFT
jgi:hypothetical protein